MCFRHVKPLPSEISVFSKLIPILHLTPPCAWSISSPSVQSCKYTSFYEPDCKFHENDLLDTILALSIVFRLHSSLLASCNFAVVPLESCCISGGELGEFAFKRRLKSHHNLVLRNPKPHQRISRPCHPLHRINLTLTRNPGNFFHPCSAVNTPNPRASASAKHAQSPSERSYGFRLA